MAAPCGKWHAFRSSLALLHRGQTWGKKTELLQAATSVWGRPTLYRYTYASYPAPDYYGALTDNGEKVYLLTL